MGCNAWNHPANCNCGWGGVWHGNTPLGGYTSQKPKQSQTLYVLKGGETKRNSFVNPNASCPVCGALVFFYQSPDGGRVFFDELGPPWPKHPCTDKATASVGRILRHAKDRGGKQKQPEWEREGWEPFTGRSRRKHSKYLLFGHHPEQRTRKRGKRVHAIIIPALEKTPLIDKIQYIYYRSLPPQRGVLEVSFLTGSNNTQCIGFLNVINERELKLIIESIAGDASAQFKLAAHYANLKMFSEAYYWLEILITGGDDVAKKVLYLLKSL